MAAGRLTGDGRADRRLVQAGLADEDEAGGPGFPGPPVEVVIVLQPLADALHHPAHRLAGYGGKALYPQPALGGADRAHAFPPGPGALTLADPDRTGGASVGV